MGRTALQLIDFRGHGIDLDAQRRGGLVNQVDGLVGQEAVRDVAVRQRGRRDDSRVLDAHAVVNLIFFFQPAKNGDCVFHRGLADIDGLETPFQSSVLFDVLAVLVQGCSANGTQFATG